MGNGKWFAVIFVCIIAIILVINKPSGDQSKTWLMRDMEVGNLKAVQLFPIRYDVHEVSADQILSFDKIWSNTLNRMYQTIMDVTNIQFFVAMSEFVNNSQVWDLNMIRSPSYYRASDCLVDFWLAKQCEDHIRHQEVIFAFNLVIIDHGNVTRKSHDSITGEWRTFYREITIAFDTIVYVTRKNNNGFDRHVLRRRLDLAGDGGGHLQHKLNYVNKSRSHFYIQHD